MGLIDQEQLSDPPGSVIKGEDIGLPMICRMSRITVRTAEPIGWHSHHSYEILFVIKGEASYEFKDREPIKVSGGSFLVIPPHVQHCGLNHVRTPVSLLGFICHPQWESLAKGSVFGADDLTLMIGILGDSVLEVHLCDTELTENVELVKDLFDASSATGQIPPLLRCKLRAGICSLLANVVQNLQQPNDGDTNRVMQKILSYLELHATETLQISDLVKYSGFSRSHLFNLFKESVGMTPNDYLLRCRIQRASKLLTKTDQTITQIALEAGFSSSQYFSQVFKRYTGLSPHDYRLK